MGQLPDGPSARNLESCERLRAFVSHLNCSALFGRRVLWRYWLGVTPTNRANERRITSALPNPQTLRSV